MVCLSLFCIQPSICDNYSSMYLLGRKQFLLSLLRFYNLLIISLSSTCKSYSRVSLLVSFLMLRLFPPLNYPQDCYLHFSVNYISTYFNPYALFSKVSMKSIFNEGVSTNFLYFLVSYTAGSTSAFDSLFLSVLRRNCLSLYLHVLSVNRYLSSAQGYPRFLGCWGGLEQDTEWFLA